MKEKKKRNYWRKRGEEIDKKKEEDKLIKIWKKKNW